MRKQLLRLHTEGIPVEQILIADDVVFPNRWVYVGDAKAIVCGSAVALDAQELWPEANVETMESLVKETRH